MKVKECGFQWEESTPDGSKVPVVCGHSLPCPDHPKTKSISTNIEVKKLVRGLKLEYYDLLHKHGYADFKLNVKKESKGYAKDEKWLEGIYVQAINELIISAELYGRLHETIEAFQAGAITADAYSKRHATITDQLANLNNKGAE